MQLDEGEGIPPQHVDTVVFVLVEKISIKRGNDSNEKAATDKDITHTEENWRKGNKPTQNHAEEKNRCEGATIERKKSRRKPAGRSRKNKI